MPARPLSTLRRPSYEGPTHDSGPQLIASLYYAGTRTPYSLPAFTGAFGPTPGCNPNEYGVPRTTFSPIHSSPKQLTSVFIGLRGYSRGSGGMTGWATHCVSYAPAASAKASPIIIL